MSELKVLKPVWRGVSHQVAFVVAGFAGLALVLSAPSPRAAGAAGIYALALAALFGVSAAYHRINWDAVARLRMRRLDHATIFLFIAGSYTPICLLALPADVGHPLLAMAWAGALVGVARAVLWPNAPKAIAASLYVALGWLVVWQMPAVMATTGPAAVAAFALGGVLYSLGAVIYATRRPDPWPTVFGYHEVFHALVIAAAAVHFVAITRIVLG